MINVIYYVILSKNKILKLNHIILVIGCNFNNKIIDDLIQNIKLYNGKILFFINKHI